jgi:DNA polymerase elongation subunit (family B)
LEQYTNVGVRGNRILYRGYATEGGRKRRIQQADPNFRPTLFVKANKASNWKTLDGIPVEPVQPGTIMDCREFINQYKGVGGFSIHGNTDYIAQFIGENFKEIDYNFSNLKVAFLDIETECENGFPDPNRAEEKVIVITIGCEGIYHCFALGKAVPHQKNVKLYEYDNEDEMLQAFIDFWRSEDYDIVTGWNTQLFDIPYLVNRIGNRMGEDAVKRLSPWNDVKTRDISMKGKMYEVFDIVGVTSLDYLDLYKKFTFVNQESYKLDNIAFVELGERKASYAEYDKMSDFYKQNFQAFVEYNIKDVHLVQRLEEKLKLLELAVTLAYSAKVNFSEVFSQVRTWDSIIYHHLNEQKIVIPPKKDEDKSEQFAGAYVKDPIIGMHKWVVSFDLDSLYPHLIMQFNISPETKVKGKEKKRIPIDDLLQSLKSGAYQANEYSTAANGVSFVKDIRGFLPALMDTMYQERKVFKEKMLECKRRLKEQKDTLSKTEKRQLENDISKFHNFQLCRKIQLNSAFGAIGNEYFRYYDLDLAEAITVSGQLSIRWIEEQLNGFLNASFKTGNYDYVVASDTDSIYLRLENLVQRVMPNETDDSKIAKYLEKVSQELVQPFIDKKYDELSRKMNAYENKMHMKREAIANKGIWTAKKRYMLNVMIGEDGVVLKKPEMKIMGIETSRSSTPRVVRDALTDSISIIMNGTQEEIISYISDFKNKFKAQRPEDISYPRSCNGLKDYHDPTTIFRKSTPIAVRGSLVYNHHLRNKKMDKKYPIINEGDKIKFIYLKMPNPLGENVIAFMSSIPSEFGLAKYIDFNTQFDKSYLDPLKAILDCIGWQTEKTNTLDSLFCD